MNKLVLSLLLIVSCISSNLFAQEPVVAPDTLPKFSLRNVGGHRIIVGWTNTFETVKQITIQRSLDSVTGFKSILTVPDPDNLQNGYVDTKATHDSMFYRLYIMLDKGTYLFSKAKRPVVDSLKPTLSAYERMATGTNPDRMNRMAGNDSVAIPNFGVNNTKVKPEVFTPSLHVYTFRDGYVRINLPDDEDKKYNVKFFTADDEFLFEIKDPKERTFKIDKTNFYRSGWFKFELYEDGKLWEKHKFFIQKEF